MPMLSGSGSASSRNSCTAFASASARLHRPWITVGSTTWSMIVREGLKDAAALCAM